ncbi:hypothetical protein C0J52_15034 [Blattella germanica]|nr:hypothetical protein C0J52_15034 [Blattella germanica]
MADSSKAGPSCVEGSNTEQTETYASNEEYFNALEKWLQNVYLWQNIVATFPYAMMTNQLTHPNVINGQAGVGTVPYIPVTQENGFRMRRPQVATVRPLQLHQGEFLDFLILFLLKLAVTFVAADFFDFIDLDKYDLDVLQPNVKIDYKIALEMTSEILFLELIHRVVVCIFEVCWNSFNIFIA